MAILRVRRSFVPVGRFGPWWAEAGRSIRAEHPELIPMFAKLLGGSVIAIADDADFAAILAWAIRIPGWGRPDEPHPLVIEEMTAVQEAALRAQLKPDDPICVHFKHAALGGEEASTK